MGSTQCSLYEKYGEEEAGANQTKEAGQASKPKEETHSKRKRE